ncbi:MAG TPA: hypothetical protein VFP21_12815 [Solirubrobacterales bacterium]|nr:hypothetical protein [Solirubrobacterales bacterium]
MILSVHIAGSGLGPFTPSPSTRRVDGLRYAQVLLPADLGRKLPAPQLGAVALLAAWEDEGSLDSFLSEDSRGKGFASGWHVRMQPLRASGSWSGLPGIEDVHEEAADEEPAAVLTLGRLRLSQGIRFVRSSSPAERAVIKAPGLLASTGLAKPPLVSTFSLWRTTGEMKEYAYGKLGESHTAAIRAHREKPFHKESLFARFRPYHSEGTWRGADPFESETLPERTPTSVA